MSKSILVMDTPKCCDYCPVGRIFGMTGQVECMASNDIRVNEDGKTIPHWCPLKELPKKKPETSKYGSNVYYAEGYNAFIDEILKEVFENPIPYNGDNIGGKD